MAVFNPTCRGDSSFECVVTFTFEREQVYYVCNADREVKRFCSASDPRGTSHPWIMLRRRETRQPSNSGPLQALYSPWPRLRWLWVACGLR